MGRKIGSWVGGIEVHEKADPWAGAATALMAGLLLVPAAGHWYARHWLGVVVLTVVAAIGIVLLTATPWQTVGVATLGGAWALDVAHTPIACKKLNARLAAFLGTQ